MPAELATQLVRAVSTQNEAALVECFSPDVEFRALIPPGLRERTGALDAAALFSQWLGDSTELQLVDSSSHEVGDRLHVSYQLAGVEEGEAYLVEHHLFYTVEDGKIRRADLLCSGFQPRTQ
ncbi:MAG: nuclear transport factor 2 family protein [Gaiellaceae bacterium]